MWCNKRCFREKYIGLPYLDCMEETKSLMKENLRVNATSPHTFDGPSHQQHCMMGIPLP